MDAHIELAKAYIMAEQFNSAARQLVEIVRIADSIKNGHRLEADSSVEKIKDILLPKDRDKIIGELNKICGELHSTNDPTYKYCQKLLDELQPKD